ncbi:hypothetical protein GH714_044067 [Hevea brasiliensis]|uniref:Retrotransposon gag domain-containing protein n=1 Tax=Hevea brasiliensis TaxID=3981 RepID=A0A6A6K122_HEVBR|nr:hypothetical protein GH714_044067 [Hevea brasiliensis]
MSDPSEIVPGTSVAPTVVEQGSRRRRGKSRDPSRAREELGDLETRLAKIELHLIDGDEKVEELDTRIEELDGGMEEFREEMQGALNRAVKIMGEGESLKISFSNEVAALREENRFLREELDRVMGKVKDMEEQMSLVRMAILQGSVVGAATTSIAPTARVEVPKPNAFHGGRNAKEIDNFLWSLEQYFRALGITEDARKIDHAPLPGRHRNELKKQFYPENAAHEARAKLRRLSHKGNIREYVKEFMETLLEIPDYPDTEALFAFTDGLQNWARLEIERRGARDLATAVSIAESLIELHRRERNSSPQKERNEGSSSHGKMEATDRTSRRKGTTRFRRKTKVEGQRPRNLEGAAFCPNEGRRTGGAALMDTGASNNFLRRKKPRVRAWGRLRGSGQGDPNAICQQHMYHRGRWYIHGSCVAGKPSPSKTLATMHVEVQKPSSPTAVVQGKEQHGKGGGTPKSGPKECKEGNTPKLLKGHPPRRKVDCARGNSVARSPGMWHRQGRESEARSLMEEQTEVQSQGRAGAPSHKDEGGTEAQLEQAQGNKSSMDGDKGGGPNDEGVGGLSGGECHPINFTPEEAHRVSWGAIWQVQAEMRFKLPSRAQNEVHCGLEAYWRLRQRGELRGPKRGGRLRPHGLLEFGVDQLSVRDRGNWEALGTATGPSGGATGRQLGTATGRRGQLGGTGHCHGPVEGATGRHWALPRARRGQLGALGTATGPLGATGRHWALPRANRGSNWEALGTATGPSGATGRHHCLGPVRGNWEALALPRARRGSNWEDWALPRARRGQLGGTGHCHGPVGGNWEALGTATGPSGQLGGTGHCHGPVRGNWEALGTATGPSGATGRHWALPRANRGEQLGGTGTATGPSGQLGGTGHCHGPVGGSNWEDWALPRPVLDLGKGWCSALDL